MNKFTAILLFTGFLIYSVYSPIKLHAQDNIPVNSIKNPSLLFGKIKKDKLNNDNSFTTKTWVGAGSGGAGTDFNAAANWSPSGAPGPLDDCVMNPTAAATVTLSDDITINSLTITFNAPSGSPVWNLRAEDFALTINGNLTASNTGSASGSKQLVFRVGNAANVTTGAIIVGGNAVFGSSGPSQVLVTGVSTSRARYEFMGDVTFGTQCRTSTSAFPYRYVFSKSSGTQTLTVNNNSIDLSAVEIGDQTTSFPTLVLAGSSNTDIHASAPRNYLRICDGATLDLSTHTLNNTASGDEDTLYLGNSATIKAGAQNGGVTGSNFPNHFAGYQIFDNSTIVYNGTTGAQTQRNLPNLYNVTIDNSAGVTLATATTINGTLTLSKGQYTNPSNRLTMANGSTISRDIGTLSAIPVFNTNVNIIYTGTTAVTTGKEMPIASSTILNDLTIDKSGGVTLDSSRTVKGILTFISGNLNTGTKTLTLSSTGLLTGESLESYLVGRLSTTQDVGIAASTFGDIGVEIDEGTDDIGNVTVLRISGPSGIVTVGPNSGIARTWNITADEEPTGSGRILSFYWVSPDDNSKDMSQVEVWRKVGASAYDEFSFIQDVTGSDPRYITSYSTYNLINTTWTVADLTQPLPVELVSFIASINGRNAELKWITAFEINNRGFDIERRSMDKTKYGEWKPVGFVNGNGTTNEQKSYSFEDKNLAANKYQYRLKQIDFNGNSDYFMLNSPSELVIGKPNIFDLSQNYPNPSNPNSKIDYQIPENSMVSLKIYNLLGQEVASLVNEQKEAGFYTAVFDGSNFASGIYFYRLIIANDSRSYSKTMKMILVK